MENAFTLAELTGTSASEALFTVWWLPVLLFVTIVTGHIVGLLYVDYRYGSRLQPRVQRLRWKIAAFICPEMEQMADESVDLKYGYISEAIRGK